VLALDLLDISQRWDKNTVCLQVVYFKSLYVWEGDCSATAGSKILSKAGNGVGFYEEADGDAFAADWNPQTLDSTSAAGKGRCASIQWIDVDRGPQKHVAKGQQDTDVLKTFVQLRCMLD
jgi:hypothetical protein